MATDTPADIHMQDAYRALAAALDTAPNGTKGAIRAEFERMHGVSQHTVFRELAKVGWSSQRKTRKDAGTSAIDDVVLSEIESATMLSIRANGKSTMPTTVALSMLAANGRDINVSASRINQLRRQRKSTTKHQKALAPHQQVKSLHANHVHQVDPSYCLLYYAPSGDQLVQKFVDESEFYANKPDNLEKIKNLKCWRYVLTDHFSGSIIVRYYQSKGENSTILWDFLLYCWQKLEGRPFRGVPDILVWDKGSANTAHSIKNALRALQVEAIEHQAKNARAKGSVEKSNDIVECQFESRLRFEPVNSVDELNAAVEAWYNAYNANLIPKLDSRLNRRGMAKPLVRYDMWQTILRKPELLRELPPVEVCRYLLQSKPVERKVSGHLEVSFKHPKAANSLQYSVRDIPGVIVGEKVFISPLYYGDCEVMLTFTNYLGEEFNQVLTPVEYDEAGFAVDAPVWGQTIAAMPDTEVEKRKKAADALAYPGKNEDEIKKAKAKQETPFGGEINAHSHLKNITQPTYMQRQGTSIELPAAFVPAQREPLTRLQLKKLVMEALGRGLEPWEIERLATYTDVFDEDITRIVDELQRVTMSPLQLVK